MRFFSFLITISVTAIFVDADIIQKRKPSYPFDNCNDSVNLVAHLYSSINGSANEEKYFSRSEGSLDRLFKSANDNCCNTLAHYMLTEDINPTMTMLSSITDTYDNLVLTFINRKQKFVDDAEDTKETAVLIKNAGIHANSISKCLISSKPLSNRTPAEKTAALLNKLSVIDSKAKAAFNI